MIVLLIAADSFTSEGQGMTALCGRLHYNLYQLFRSFGHSVDRLFASE